ERHDKSEARAVAVEAPDHRGRTALENTHDPPFGPFAGEALDSRNDAVAVHRLIEVAAGNKKVPLGVLERTIGHHESKAAGIGDHLADDQVHAVGQTESIAARLHEGAALDQIGQQLLERGTLLTWQLETL